MQEGVLRSRPAAVPGAGGPPAPPVSSPDLDGASPPPSTAARPGPGGPTSRRLGSSWSTQARASPRWSRSNQNSHRTRNRCGSGAAVVGQVPAHGGGQVARLGLQPLGTTRPGRGRAAAGRPARPAPGSSRRAGARSRRRRAGPPAARPRTRGWSPASAAGGRGRCCRAGSGCAGPAPRTAPAPGPRPGRPPGRRPRTVQPSTNTAMVSSSDRSASSSRPTLHSTVARRVRCRSGRSTAPVPERVQRRWPAGAAARPGRAAGSGRPPARCASGRPSSRRQISATAAALPSVSAKPGRTARARSTNSATAGEAASSATGTVAGSAGSGSGGTGYSRSARSPSTVRLVARITTPRTAGQQLAEVAGGVDHLLQVVQDRAATRSSPNVLDQRLQRRVRSRPGRRPTARAMPASTSSGSVTASSGTNAVPASNRSRSRSPTATASRVLPTPPGPVSVTSRTSGRPSQPGHLVDGLLPPDQRRRARRQRARAAARAAPWPRPGRRAAANRSLSSTARSSRTSRPSSARRAEVPVGRRGLLLGCGPAARPGRGSRSGAGALTYSSRGSPPRQLGTPPPAPRPPCPAPTRPYRCQYSPMNTSLCARYAWYTSRGGCGRAPSLEHHRRQPQRRDRPRDRPPLVGQLAQRRTHEHPHALVRSPDRHISPATAGSRASSAWRVAPASVCNRSAPSTTSSTARPRTCHVPGRHCDVTSLERPQHHPSARLRTRSSVVARFALNEPHES